MKLGKIKMAAVTRHPPRSHGGNSNMADRLHQVFAVAGGAVQPIFKGYSNVIYIYIVIHSIALLCKTGKTYYHLPCI